jgi:thiaminase
MTIMFADILKQYSIETWQKILNHRFIIELSKDILPVNKFLFYLKQDTIVMIGNALIIFC